MTAVVRPHTVVVVEHMTDRARACRFCLQVLTSVHGLILIRPLTEITCLAQQAEILPGSSLFAREHGTKRHILQIGRLPPELHRLFKTVMMTRIERPVVVVHHPANHVRLIDRKR